MARAVRRATASPERMTIRPPCHMTPRRLKSCLGPHKIRTGAPDPVPVLASLSVTFAPAANPAHARACSALMRQRPRRYVRPTKRAVNCRRLSNCDGISQESPTTRAPGAVCGRSRGGSHWHHLPPSEPIHAADHRCGGECLSTLLEILRRWNPKGVTAGIGPVASPILGRPSRICPRVESSEEPDTMMHSPAVESSDETVESSEFPARRINGLIELSRGKPRGI